MELDLINTRARASDSRIIAVYRRLLRAAKRGTGVHLRAADVRAVAHGDDAIFRAVLTEDEMCAEMRADARAAK